MTKVNCNLCVSCERCVSDWSSMINECSASEDSDYFSERYEDKTGNYFWFEMSGYRYSESHRWESEKTEWELWQEELMVDLIG